MKFKFNPLTDNLDLVNENIKWNRNRRNFFKLSLIYNIQDHLPVRLDPYKYNFETQTGLLNGRKPTLLIKNKNFHEKE